MAMLAIGSKSVNTDNVAWVEDTKENVCIGDRWTEDLIPVVRVHFVSGPCLTLRGREADVARRFFSLAQPEPVAAAWTTTASVEVR